MFGEAIHQGVHHAWAGEFVIDSDSKSGAHRYHTIKTFNHLHSAYRLNNCLQLLMWGGPPMQYSPHPCTHPPLNNGALIILC